MKTLALPLALLALASPAWAADPAAIDWSGVPAKTLTLFYPGQSTYQWLRSPSEAILSSGAPRAGDP